MYGWGTEEEEDVWDIELDIVSPEADGYDMDAIDVEMTISELMEWRYIRAEREKEQVIVQLFQRNKSQSDIHATNGYREMPLSRGRNSAKLSNDINSHIKSNPKCPITVSTSPRHT